MATQPAVITARQPAETIRPTPGGPLSRSFFVVAIIALFVAAIVLNLVIEGGVFMWLMTVFGAFVITALLAAAGAHVFSKH